MLAIVESVIVTLAGDRLSTKIDPPEADPLLVPSCPVEPSLPAG